MSNPVVPEAELRVPEFVLVEFERWWSGNHLDSRGGDDCRICTSVEFATRYEIAKHAWITAYLKGLDVDY